MQFGERALRIGMGLALVGVALVTASCGAGNNGPPIAVSAISPTSFTATAASGGAATFDLSGAPLGLMATATSSTTAPSGLPAPSSNERMPQSIAGAVVFLYVSLVLNDSVPASVFTREMVTLTGTDPTSNANYFVEIDDPTAVSPKLTTVPGTLSGNVVTFVNANGSGGTGLTTLAANHTYVFQFYYVPTAPGVLGVTPTSVALYGLGSSNAQTVQVRESGYSGTFVENDTCSGIATVTPSSATGPSATFTVTGVAAGGCNATFSDSFGQHAGTAIGVTTSGFGIDTHARGGAR